MASRTQPSSVPPEALLEPLPTPLAEIANRLREIVANATPGVVERVRAGWGIIGFDLQVDGREVYFAWIWPQAQPRHAHVHLGFVHGVLLDDPDGELEGRGVTKHARWLTIRPGETVDERAADRWVRAAAGLASLPSALRTGLLRDAWTR